MAPPPQQHFLVATYPAQGTINPALHLAKRLVRTTGAIVTFSTTVSAHRRMFPSNHDDDGTISYIPFSDGYDNGFNSGSDDIKDYLSQFKSEGSRTLAAVARSLAAAGRPVTCLIYAFLLPWAAEVARQLAIPSVLYWIQPATVFTIYYHYFHGSKATISAHMDDPLFTVALPGLPALQIRDLPSFLTTSKPISSSVLPTFKDLFETLDEEEEKGGRRARVLMNTYEALEADAINAVGGKLDVIPIGPLLPFSFMGGGEDSDAGEGDMIKPEDGKAYMEWLDSKTERSVVYISFGSMAVLSKRQVEEISRGLEESGRPYLWVLRRDCRWEGLEFGGELGMGMVVEWCSQLKVLSHPSIGCFVTHCGWNSTLESLVGGVPTVGVPQWSDQLTIARLVETEWGTGVKGMVDEHEGEAVLEGKELQRCLEAVMGEGERGVEIRRATATWRDRAIQAVGGDGSSHRNLTDFLEKVSQEC